MQRIAPYAAVAACALAMAAGCSAAQRTPDVEAQLLALIDQVQHVDDVAPATAQRVFGVTPAPRGRSGVNLVYYGEVEGTPIAIDVRAIEHDQVDAIAWSTRRHGAARPETPATCLASFDRIAAELKHRGFMGRNDSAGPWGDPPPAWAGGIWVFHRGSTRVVVWRYPMATDAPRYCVNNFGVQVDSKNPSGTYDPPKRRPIP